MRYLCNMKISILCLMWCVLVSWGSYAQEKVEVYPVPQKMTLQGQTFQLPSAFRLVGAEKANPFAVAKLREIYPSEGDGAFQVIIGKRGDKALRKYAQMIPKQAEGYYLQVSANQIVLAGADDRGTYYAVRTLEQLVKDGQVPAVEIEDWPTIRFRGVVEGFYGTPWSHQARLRQLAFYGANKMNTYIYGPKDDPYHSCPNWRKPYPAEEAGQIRELAAVAKENEVDFAWAIHPGQDIKWNDEDRNLLLAKFENMYELGVRAFAVFFDDITGEGTNPEKQAELLNDIDNRFVKVKGDVKPLIMCPTEYNKSWSDPAKGYLATLGTKLNPSVQIMWTGDWVISDITGEGLDWVNEKIRRPAYIWWNFPVSDYVRDHLLMGAVYGLDTHAGNKMSGFMTNPMEHAEASKVAIFSVADYAWNPERFDSDASWRVAVRRVLPEEAEMLQIFVNHNSDLGVNVHRYRREESVEIQEEAARFLKNYREGRLAEKGYFLLSEEFAKIIEAADRLSVLEKEQPLIAEIRPWLEQFKNLGLSGREALEMVKALERRDYDGFLRKYKHIKALQQKAFEIEQTYIKDPYQPGIKTGSKVLQPLVDSLFICATERYNQRNNAHLDSRVFTSPHYSYSTVGQCCTAPVRVQGNRVVISPILEVVRWGAGEYVGVELDAVYNVKAFEADFGTKSSGEWMQLEVSENGTDWKVIPFLQNGTRLKADLNVGVRYVRMQNKSDQERQSYLRQFSLVL